MSRRLLFLFVAYTAISGCAKANSAHDALQTRPAAPVHTYNLLAAVEKLTRTGGAFAAINKPGHSAGTLRVYTRQPDTVFAGRRVRRVRIRTSDAWHRSSIDTFYTPDGKMLGEIAGRFSARVMKLINVPRHLRIGQHGRGGTVAWYRSPNFHGVPLYFDYTWNVKPDLVIPDDALYCETAHPRFSRPKSATTTGCFELGQRNSIDGLRLGEGRKAYFLSRRE